MPLSFWMKVIAAGLVGGAVGAACWAVLTLLTGLKLGIFAWVIGSLVGSAIAAFVSSENTSAATGVIAVVIALLSIAGGKFAAGWVFYDKVQADTIGALLESDPEFFEFVVSYIADDIVEERESGGVALEWPRGQRPVSPSGESDYPADVWQEAQERWTSLDEQSRIEYVALDVQLLPITRPKFAAQFALSFGLFDVVFVVLAGATAFKLAGGFG